MTHQSFTRNLKAEAKALGLDLVGVAPADPSGHMGFYRRWIEERHHGEMSYLERSDAVARRADLTATFDTVRSVVVAGQNYFQADPDGVPDDPGRGVVARYARGRDYHKVLTRRLEALLAWVRAEAPEKLGVEVDGRVYVDTGPILERELAQRAGLGWFGRNTMLLHPRKGSYFFLGTLLLDVELEPDEPFTEDHCGTCNRCVEACPTGALLGRDEDGAPVMDARLCISYLTIENRGPIPRELRPLIGNRVYGCDICQEVCPWNTEKFVEIANERDYRADWRKAENRPEIPSGLPGTESPSLIELMRMTREQWDVWTRGTAIRRAGYAGFKRNVAVAMGNWLAEVDEPPEGTLAVLRDAIEHDEPLVGEHAAWALKQAR